MMPDRKKVIKGLQEIVDDNWMKTHADWYVSVCSDAIALLKEQEEQKRKWLQTIADTQLAISPTGYESENELAKRGWEWNGLQMAWEIIAGEERSEHPMLVRCKDCKHGDICKDETGQDIVECFKQYKAMKIDWFCADGERKEGR